MQWYVYIVECKDSVLYIGTTQDVNRRFKEHRIGIGGHFTKYQKAQKILYIESFDCKNDAKKREAQLKRWSRAKKLALIRKDFDKLRNLSRSRD